VESIILAFALIALVMFLVYWALKRPKWYGALPSQEVVRPASPPPPIPARQVPSRLSAAEMLSRVQALRNGDAQWDAIWSELNPTRDPEVQRLLVEIRGPHMFVPHLGLNVIEDGCKRVLSVSPEADALTALREAIRSQEPFVR
jgi:hypothetical protein